MLRSLSTIPIYPGCRRLYQNVNLTQNNQGFGRCNLVVYSKWKYRRRQEPER
mgnify:CR=1 FL=1|jgi:hypothetical protein